MTRSISRCIKTRKRCFVLLADVIDAITRAEKADKRLLFPYVCSFCEAFHMTKRRGPTRLFVDKVRGKGEA